MPMLDGRDIVFLPGIDGTGVSLDPLRPFMAHDAHVTVVRYPAQKRLDFEETVACAEAQMPSERENLVVIAESFSGPVAIRLVGANRVKAKCLVLCSTFARSPRPVAWALGRHLPLERLLRLPQPRCVLRHVIAGGEETIDLFIHLWRRVKETVPMEVLVHRLAVVDGVDVRPWLSRITIPCLYIQAASDRTVPGSALFDFIDGIPDLRVRRIRGPHFILQARPRESLAAVQAFLARL